jgi:esterase/lipase
VSEKNDAFEDYWQLCKDAGEPCLSSEKEEQRDMFFEGWAKGITALEAKLQRARDALKKIREAVSTIYGCDDEEWACDCAVYNLARGLLKDIK